MSSLRQSSATSPTSPVARNVYSRASVDVETGEIQQQQNSGHKRPYTPGASPREILCAQQSLRQLPSPSQTSPHGSRFMDGYRRRMRQASLNLPSETLLDEDLGFPPVCSPPPEVFCGSIVGNQMRNRSNSEAQPGLRMRSSHSLGNGGLLVFFPTSPSSSSNNSGHLLQHRRESHTDETAEEAIIWSTNNDTSDEMMDETSCCMVADDISMKDVEMPSPIIGGAAGGSKSLKRPPDLNGSNNSGSSSSSSGGANSGVQQSSVHPSNSYSPRSRPLFVDTQMANHLQDSNMKRRSPVSQVVDFVRGRNRTYSLQLSSSPMCSPQSVAARASASCDGCNGPPPPPQPIGMSPSGRRQTISGRVHRASFTAGGTLKSFDSGLDLSSPTINHTALLIKENYTVNTMGDQFDSLMERIRVRQAEMSGEGEVAKENGPVTSKITSVKQEVASPTKVFGSSSKCNDGPSTPVHFHPQEPKETTPNMKENAENSLNSFKDATVNESSSKKTSRFSMLAQEIDEYEYDYQSQYNKPKEAYMKGRSPRMSIGETRPAVLCTPAGAQAMKSPNVAVSSKSAPEIALGMSDFEARRIKFAQPIVNVNYLPNESSIFSGGSGSSVNDQSTVLGGSAEMMNVTTSSLSCGELSMNQHITHENTIINAQSCDNREAILRERQQVSNEEYGPHTFMRKKVPKEASSATSSSSSTTTLTTISGASGSTTSGISNAPQDSASTKTTTNTFTSSYLLTKTSNNNINALVSSSPKPFSKDIGRSMFSPVHFTPKSTSSPKTLSESIFSPSKSAAVEGSIATTRRLQFEEKLKKSSSANVTAPPAPTSAPVPTPRHVAPLAPTVAQQSHLTPNHRHAAQQKKHLFPVVGIVATAPIPVQTQWRGQSNTPVVQGARADEKTAGNEPPVGAGVGKLKNLKSRWEFSSATGTPIHPDATEDSLIATAIKMKESAIPKQLGHRSERKGPSASSLYSQGARSNTASPASKSTRYEQEEEDDVFEAPEFNDGGDVISEDGILQEEEEDTSKFIDNAFGFMEGSGAGTPSPYREPPLQRLEKNRPPAEVIEEETENEDESEPYEPEEEEDDDATTQFPVPERSRKSSSQLAYSVSFYRKIQRDRNEESSTVLAGPVISQISPSAPPMSSSLTSQQKLRQLTTGPANGARIVESAKDAHDRIKRAIQVEEQLVAQSKRAMILARDKPSFRGSREEFEAQWAMLRHVEKHRALLTEYDRLKRDGPRIIDGPRGTITVSQLSVNMARDYVSANIASSKKSDEVFYFAAILRYGEQVDVSKMVTSDGGLNRRGVLEFPVPLMLTGIPPDFRATVEIYGQRSMRESTSHEDKYKLKNSTFKAKTRNTFLGGGSTSSANQSLFVDPAASSSSTSSTTSNFNLLGTFSFDINCPGKHLYNMSHTVYPLEGITQMKVRKQAIDGADITYHGFLSMYQRTGEGLGSWTRYWCALENGEMKFWKQPEDEGTKGYTALMDLSTCCRSEGASVVEDICPFPNSFHIDVWAPKMDTSDPRGIERLRVMLAADTAQDLQTWLSLINSTSKQLCTWRNPIVNQ